jgi:hypothetical protein
MRKSYFACLFVIYMVALGGFSTAFMVDKAEQLRKIVEHDIADVSKNYFQLLSFNAETEQSSTIDGGEQLRIKYNGIVNCSKSGGWMTVEKDGKIIDFTTDNTINYSKTIGKEVQQGSHNALTVVGYKYKINGWLEVARKGDQYEMVKNEYSASLIPKEVPPVNKPPEPVAVPSRPPNDDSILQDYFKKNNIQPTKTATGLYYTVEHRRSTPRAISGQVVSVNYTGTLLDGTKFDSNTDSLFRHVKPFTFQLGRGAVIAGWDEGILLLRKGSRAKFYIPSSLAYRERSPSPKIPAYSTLIFDVELTDIE